MICGRPCVTAFLKMSRPCYHTNSLLVQMFPVNMLWCVQTKLAKVSVEHTAKGIGRPKTIVTMLERPDNAFRHPRKSFGGLQQC